MLEILIVTFIDNIYYSIIKKSRESETSKYVK